MYYRVKVLANIQQQYANICKNNNILFSVGKSEEESVETKAARDHTLSFAQVVKCKYMQLSCPFYGASTSKKWNALSTGCAGSESWDGSAQIPVTADVLWEVKTRETKLWSKQGQQTWACIHSMEPYSTGGHLSIFDLCVPSFRLHSLVSTAKEMILDWSD